MGFRGPARARQPQAPWCGTSGSTSSATWSTPSRRGWCTPRPATGLSTTRCRRMPRRPGSGVSAPMTPPPPSAWTPAVARGGADGPAEGITVAVTAGGDPRRAVAVRDAVAAALDSGTLPVRRVRRPASALGGSGAGRVGRVSLVGGGPGAEDLITVRGRALLAAADVVVVDRLGPRGLLATLGDGRRGHRRRQDPRQPPRQPGADQRAPGAPRAGRASAWSGSRAVTRSSSGVGERRRCTAPSTASRSRSCPGVTSAVSVPAAAGIPVTHRGITASFVVASAHEGADAVLGRSSGTPRWTRPWCCSWA